MNRGQTFSWTGKYYFKNRQKQEKQKSKKKNSNKKTKTRQKCGLRGRWGKNCKS